MDIEEAKNLLNGAVRHELRDHAFGDAELFWELDGEEVGSGYFGSGHASVTISTEEYHNFEGDDARELRKCGTLGDVERNDETGPNTYSEGTTMPGLTLEGVREELTR